MNEKKNVNILQRLPVVLAVTAASYGLNVSQAQTPAAKGHDSKHRTSVAAQGAQAKRPAA